MREIFEEHKSIFLKGAIIWAPMLAADGLNAAQQHAARISESRITHYWDPDRIMGRLLAQTLNLNASIAWDVYLVYSPDHPWDTGLPPAPEFWMHQLDEEPTLYLDPLRFKQTVQAVIERSF